MTRPLEVAQHHTVPVVPLRIVAEASEGSKMMYNDKQLTAAIKNAATVERLAQLVHTCSLNPIHIATMFVKLTSLSKTSAQGVSVSGLTSRERMQTLQIQEQLTAHLQQVLLASQCEGHCCRGLANIVWALGKLQPTAEVLSMLLDKFFSQLSESVPQDIANVLWGVAQITRDRGLTPGILQAAAPGHAQEPSLALAAPQGVVIVGRRDSGCSSTGTATGQPGSAAAQHALLSIQQVQQLLQRLVDTLHQAAPQTISNITCALCVLQHCHQWCMCSCLLQIRDIITAFANNLTAALPSHVQKVVRCLTQLSVACSTHARQEWVEWQPPLLQNMLTNLVLQRRTVKQFHIASVLRDVTQLSCLFLQPEQAAEIAGTAAAEASDSHHQEQEVLRAVAAAAAAIDETLDLHSRGYSADDLGDDMYGSVRAQSCSMSFNAPLGRVQDTAASGFSAPAAIAGTEGVAQQRSPVSVLVHNIVSGMFRRLVLEDCISTSAAGNGSTGKQSWGDILSEAEQQQLQAGSKAPAVTATVLSSPSPVLPSPEADDACSVDGRQAAAVPASKPSAQKVLDKVNLQLERLGVLQQYNTLKALCVQQGPFGMDAGPSTAPSFMQPCDRPVYSRPSSVQDFHQYQHPRSSAHANWEQQQMQGSGGMPGQQQRWWDRNTTQPRMPLRGGQSFAGLQQGLASSFAGSGGQITYGRASPASNMSDVRDGGLYSAGGHSPSTVGRVYVQQQLINSSNYLPAQQYQVSPGQPYDVARRQLQQFSVHDAAVSAGLNTTTEQLGDPAMESPFERTGSLVGRSGSSSSSTAPPGILSPKDGSAAFSAASGFYAHSGSSTTGTSVSVRFGLSSDNSSFQSGQTHSSGVGGSGSFISHSSALQALGSANYAGTAHSGTAIRSLSGTSYECALVPGDIRVQGLGIPAAHEMPVLTGQDLQQHLSFVAGAHQQRVQQLQVPGSHGPAGLLSQPPGLIVSGFGSGSAAAGGTGQQQLREQQVNPFVIIMQHGQEAAYRQMADGTLVPVGPAQQLQQGSHLTDMANLDASVSTEGLSAAVSAGLQQQLELGLMSGRAAGLGTSVGPQQQQGTLQYCIPGGSEVGTSQGDFISVAALDQSGAQQASYWSTNVPVGLADASGALAANQLLLQQQQQQLQQTAAQQQYVHLPSGQVLPVSGPGFSQTGSGDFSAVQNQLGLGTASAGANIGQQSAAAGLGGNAGFILSPETAQLLAGYQGQQQAQQQQAQQQQQMFYVMPKQASF